MIVQLRQKFLKFAIVFTARGKPFAVAGPGGKPPYALFTFGSSARAAYWLFEHEQDHPMVKKMLQDKLCGVTVFIYETPDDTIEFNRDFNNEFSNTRDLIEVIAGMSEFNTAWKAHRIAKTIEGSGSFTDAKMFEFAKNSSKWANAWKSGKDYNIR